jgi:glycosyltransferase involved in cell wall biosynthesis
VVEAVSSLRDRGIDARLLLAGQTGPFRRPTSLNGSLITSGTGSRADVSSALAAADVYVHPDPVGPAPGRRGSLAAALAHGLALVAYDGPDRDHRLEHGRNCVLVDADGARVTEALQALALDPGRRRLLGDALKQTYEDSFAWRHVGGAFDALLRTLR